MWLVDRTRDSSESNTTTTVDSSRTSPNGDYDLEMGYAEAGLHDEDGDSSGLSSTGGTDSWEPIAIVGMGKS